MNAVRHNLGMLFWIVPLCLQPLIALSIAVRGQIRNFPIFFIYTLFVSARDLVLLFVRHHTRMYSWIYFLGEPLAILLGVAVIYEVLWQLIRPYETLRSLGLRLFWISVVMTVLVGLWMLFSELEQGEFRMQSVVLIERSARFVQVTVLIVFILFISHLGLTWRHYTSGVVAGFGVAAGLQLALFELRSTQLVSSDTFHLLNSMSYSIAVLVWAVYFFSPRREPGLSNQLPKTDLAHWDQILRRYLNG